MSKVKYLFKYVVKNHGNFTNEPAIVLAGTHSILCAQAFCMGFLGQGYKKESETRFTSTAGWPDILVIEEVE